MRLDAGIEVPEKRAAVAITSLAEACQDSAYYQEFHGIPLTTQKAILRAYRVLRNATIFYHGDDHALIYDAPTGKFAKVTK
jgi:hypothetical protein